MTSSTTTCPGCGHAATGKFCSQCGVALSGAQCRACAASLVAGARFCDACGTPVNAATDLAMAAPSAAGSTWIPWTIAAGLLVAITSYFLAQASREDVAPDGGTAGAPIAAAPFANGASGAAPDISQMSPRERAGRLYDRIMRYVEQGKPDSLQAFAPMALGSFEALGADMDIDARYDYGRVAQEAGAPEIAAAQADTILTQAPTHLLGLILAARTAELQGKTGTATSYWKRFTAARAGELAKKLPEYQAHGVDIERAGPLATPR